jgi:hypothetical protein
MSSEELRGVIMRGIRWAAALLLAFATAGAQAAEQDDWALFGRMLSLMQGFVQIGAEREDAVHAQRHFEGLLSGRNADANKLAEEMFGDMPGEQRGQVLGLARSLVALGQKQAQVERRRAEEGDAIRARKDLAGMGLSYFDRQQFLAAVKRDDRLAVQLYLGGRGVDPRAGLEAARGAGLVEMEQLLADAGLRK